MKKYIILILLNLGCWVGIHAQTPKKVSYTYDALNRLTEVTYPNGEKITYNYDVLGNRVNVVTTTGSCTPPAAPTVSSATINSGQTTTLTATNCAGTANWYDALTGGTTLLAGNNSYTTPALTTTTTYYASCTVGGCESTTRGSGVVNVSTGTCPVPTGMQWANKTTQSFQPYWQGIAGYSYVIRYRIVGASTWTEKSPIPCTVNGTLSTLLTSLANGTSYEWQVKTICSEGNESAYSASTILSTHVAASPCPPTLTHSTAPLPAGVYQASQSIMSQADVRDNTKYTAGQSVLLQPGFKVNGTQPFTVSIEGCPTQNPMLKMTGVTDVTINGQIYVKYDLSILNAGAFPNSLFMASPNLPACDANTNASRSWVVVYDYIAGQSVMTYCTLNSLTNVSSFSLTFLKSTTPRPFAFYIEIWDRLLNVRYVSGVAYIV